MSHGFVQSCEPPPNGLKLGYQNDGAGDLWLAVANTEWGRIPGKAKDDTCWYSYGGAEHDTQDFDWVTFPNTMTTIPNSMSGPPPTARPIGYQTDGRGDVYAAIANSEWGRIAGKANDNTCWYSYGGKEHETNDFDWLASSRMMDSCDGDALDIDFVKSDDPPHNGLNFGEQNDGRGEHWVAVAETEWGKIPGKAQDGTCWYGYNGEEHETHDFHWVVYTSPHRLVPNDNSGTPCGALAVGYQSDGRGEQYAAIANTDWGRIPGKAVDNTCWYPYGGEEHETGDFDWVVFAS